MKVYKDITWCTKDCLNMECVRNKKHIPSDILKGDIAIWQGNFSDCKNYQKPEEPVAPEFEQQDLF